MSTSPLDPLGRLRVAKAEQQERLHAIQSRKSQLEKTIATITEEYQKWEEDQPSVGYAQAALDVGEESRANWGPRPLTELELRCQETVRKSDAFIASYRQTYESIEREYPTVEAAERIEAVRLAELERQVEELEAQRK